MLTIELAGLELFGHHGVGEEERLRGQIFLFDVELDAGGRAGATDRLEDTIDYRDVVACVRAISDGASFRLLEGLASAVADALLERFPAERIRVRVRKPEVRLSVPVDYSAVAVERSRSSP